MKTKWMMDPNQSDILIKMRHSIIAYLGGTTNKFGGYVNIEDNEIEEDQHNDLCGAICDRNRDVSCQSFR